MASADPPLILSNGRIITNNPAMPRAEAMAVEDGRITWVGRTSDIPDSLLRRGEPRDLMTAVVLPGLTDAHIHIEGLGLALEQLDLVGTTSYEEVIRQVEEAVERTPKGEWILGRGWDQNDWPDPRMPTHEALSAVSPDHPVYLRRIDGHASMANKLAMDIARISADTPDPDGGRILRDASGEPSGVFVDNAVDLLQGVIPDVPTSVRKRRVEKGLAECARVGLTMVHVAGADEVELGIYRKLREEEKLPIRVYVMLDGSEERLLKDELQFGPSLDSEDWLTVRAVKLYADGALGSRGAALLKPYSDDPTTRGLLVLRRERLEGLMRRAHAAGFQCAVHAIGDRANRIVLDVYEDMQKRLPMPDPRHRVEHAQILSPEDIPRFKELGVVASMQFTHGTSDMPWAEDRLGPHRLAGAYAWASILKTGAILAQGSDAPVERPSPLLGLYAGITRQDADGSPEGGWRPEEMLSPQRALNAATRGAAQAAFMEDRLGQLSPGYWADFVVVDTDPLADPPQRLLEAEILETWVGGRRAHPPSD
jgi:predicted amidohydrolase YtcJ